MIPRLKTAEYIEVRHFRGIFYTLSQLREAVEEACKAYPTRVDEEFAFEVRCEIPEWRITTDESDEEYNIRLQCWRNSLEEEVSRGGGKIKWED